MVNINSLRSPMLTIFVFLTISLINGVFSSKPSGFRIPKNIQAALQGEVTFLGKIFGFTPFDAVPIDIINEDAIGK